MSKAIVIDSLVDHHYSKFVAYYMQHSNKSFIESENSFTDTSINDSNDVYDAEWTPSLL